VQSIVKAERLRRDRRHGLFEFVTKLVTEKPAL
jgi:guanylate kinase